MISADFSYVFVVISYDTAVATLAALALALFRFATNHIILWHALPRTSDFLHWMTRTYCKATNKTSMSGADLEFTATDISFLENLTLFNNIIIPGMAIVFILPDCFYNALFSANNITSYYNYGICYHALLCRVTTIYVSRASELMFILLRLSTVINAAQRL